MNVANDDNLLRFVRRNIGHLARACWLASEWQASSGDAESDQAASRALFRDQDRFKRMEKTLRRYMANAASEVRRNSVTSTGLLADE